MNIIQRATNERTNEQARIHVSLHQASSLEFIGHWPITRIVEPSQRLTSESNIFQGWSRPPLNDPNLVGRWRVAIVQRGTYYRRLQAYYDDRLLPSVSLPDSRLVTVIRSTSLAPLDQSRSGLCQNRSRSAIGIILLSDWFWLATLIREQRWCVALSRASVQRCELVGLRPSLRNLIIRLDYHHVVCLLSLSRYFSVFIRPNRYSLLRFDRLLTVFFDILSMWDKF